MAVPRASSRSQRFFTFLSPSLPPTSSVGSGRRGDFEKGNSYTLNLHPITPGTPASAAGAYAPHVPPGRWRGHPVRVRPPRRVLHAAGHFHARVRQASAAGCGIRCGRVCRILPRAAGARRRILERGIQRIAGTEEFGSIHVVIRVETEAARIDGALERAAGHAAGACGIRDGELGHGH